MKEIVISGPGKNSLSSALIQSLTEQINSANGEPLLLTGAGDAFCAGLDLKEVASLDTSSMEAFLRRLEYLLGALYFYPGPTVAFVNGHAIAGGCLLALFCDYRMARADGPDFKPKIGLNEVALGLQFPPRVLQMVQRLLSPRQAERVVLDASLYSPNDAKAVGLVDEVVDDLAEAKKKLSNLSKLLPEAYAASKKALRELPATDEPTDRLFLEQVVPTWVSPALKQRLIAVLRK
jgi:enoyl-CoA hydratase